MTIQTSDNWLSSDQSDIALKDERNKFQTYRYGVGYGIISHIQFDIGKPAFMLSASMLSAKILRENYQ